LIPKYKAFIAGSADLMESTFVNFKGQVEFQSVCSFFLNAFIDITDAKSLC
jgi:hypothetical protein